MQAAAPVLPEASHRLTMGRLPLAVAAPARRPAGNMGLRAGCGRLSPDFVATGTAIAILGAGGINRPPIAPVYTGGTGQEPAQVTAALVENKRHRRNEILIEVSADTPDSLKQSLAREYGAEIAEVGFVELAGVRIWHLTLAPGRNLDEVLTALLQDNRVLTAQPNYVYTPVQGAAEEGRLLTWKAPRPRRFPRSSRQRARG